MGFWNSEGFKGDTQSILYVLTALDAFSWICLMANLILFVRFWNKLGNVLNQLLFLATFCEMSKCSVELILNVLSLTQMGTKEAGNPETCRFKMAVMLCCTTLTATFTCFYYIQIPIILRKGEVFSRRINFWVVFFSILVAAAASTYTALTTDNDAHTIIYDGSGGSDSSLVGGAPTMAPSQICHTSAAAFASDFIAPMVLTFITLVATLIVVLKLVQTRNSHTKNYSRYLTARTAYVGVLISSSLLLFLSHILHKVGGVNGFRSGMTMLGLILSSLNGLFLFALFVYTEGMWKVWKRHQQQRRMDTMRIAQREVSPLRRSQSLSGALCDAEEDTLVSAGDQDGSGFLAQQQQITAARQQQQQSLLSSKLGSTISHHHNPSNALEGGLGLGAGNAGGGTTASMLVTSPPRAISGLTEDEEEAMRFTAPEVDFARETLSGIVCGGAVQVADAPDIVQEDSHISAYRTGKPVTYHSGLLDSSSSHHKSFGTASSSDSRGEGEQYQEGHYHNV